MARGGCVGAGLTRTAQDSHTYQPKSKDRKKKTGQKTKNQLTLNSLYKRIFQFYAKISLAMPVIFHSNAGVGPKVWVASGLQPTVED